MPTSVLSALHLINVLSCAIITILQFGAQGNEASTDWIRSQTLVV